MDGSNESQEGRFFTEEQRQTIAAAMARIIPSDDAPGAPEAGTIDFLDRYLSGIDFIFATPDGSGFETLEGKQAGAWRQRIEAMREKYVAGVTELDRVSQALAGNMFVRLSEGEQNRVLAELERPARSHVAELETEAAVAASEPGLQQMAAEAHLDFFPLLVLHTRQGFYADPIYGGNREHAGWAAHRLSRSAARWPRPTPGATPRCRTLRPAQPGPERRSRVTAKRKPDPVDVCIIGAGASGATAAKVLTEARPARGRALERGPWRKPESFSADELANVHRYNLWPDPLINPRTFRASAADEPVRAVVLPGAADGRRRHRPLDRLAPPHDRERVQTEDDLRRGPGSESGRLADHLPGARAVLRQGRMGVRCLRSGRRQQVRRAAQPGLSLPTAPAHPLQPEVPRGLRQTRLQLLPHARPRPCPGPTTAGRQRIRARSPSSTAIRPVPAATC